MNYSTVSDGANELCHDFTDLVCCTFPCETPVSQHAEEEAFVLRKPLLPANWARLPNKAGGRVAIQGIGIGIHLLERKYFQDRSWIWPMNSCVVEVPKDSVAPLKFHSSWHGFLAAAVNMAENFHNFEQHDLGFSGGERAFLYKFKIKRSPEASWRILSCWNYWMSAHFEQSKYRKKFSVWAARQAHFHSLFPNFNLTEAALKERCKELHLPVK